MARVGRTWTGRFLGVGLAVAFVVAALPAPAGASHSWNNYHWGRTESPFTLQLGDNVSPAWDNYLNQAAGPVVENDWTDSAALDTTVVLGQANNTKRCTPPTGRVEVCNDRYGFNGWLGVAGVWVSGGHITQGYVKLNDSYFNTKTYDTFSWRSLVMCQEVGHTLGLGHNDEDFNTKLGTCMDYSNDPIGNEYPNTHDYEQLEASYEHLDGASTVAMATAQTAGQSGVEIPDPVGPEQGGVSVFVTDLGGDNRVIQFVIWADANLMAATHAAEQAPFEEVTTDEEGISPDGGALDSHEETTEATVGGFAVGTTVVTIDAVNLRTGASRQADVVTELAAGTLLTVTGAAEEGQGLVWVPVVTSDGALAGYVAADFLTPA